eukprot:TRINITY_DN5372_c0_g1_i8.p1 TRINITY_DN5372_c0_g1~~TRINITY_DN5372_c0_g1_i8.p1  ORF type:complete len:124 (+),score=24.67 TRINITY_DN5372_c0_g1_i8:52-423(+)
MSDFLGGIDQNSYIPMLNQQADWANPYYNGGMHEQTFQTYNALPPEDKSVDYYQESCKLFIANVLLTNQMKELLQEKNELLAKIARLERGSENYSVYQESFMGEKKKRHRRAANEIDLSLIHI